MVLPRTIACLPLLLALMALPAWAQIRSEPPLSASASGLELTTQGQRLTLPPPDWVAPGMADDAVLAAFEAVFRTGEDGSDLELYHKGAIYALATALYGAHVASDPQAAPASYRNRVMDGFSQACMPGLSAFVQLGDDPQDMQAPLLLVCGAERANRRQGAVMAMSMVTSEAGLAMVYQQWRGAAFDPAKAENWPAPPETIEARARRLQAESRLTLAD